MTERLAPHERCNRISWHGEPLIMEVELDVIRRLVPLIGIRQTAIELDRDPSGIARHARRLGVKSPLSPQRPFARMPP